MCAYAVPAMPASSWPPPDVASSQGFLDSCLLPGCHAWAAAGWEGAPLHLHTRRQNVPTGTCHIHANFCTWSLNKLKPEVRCPTIRERWRGEGAYVWVRPEGCLRRSVSCGCRGSWAPPGERWWQSCRSRCCLRRPRRGWCWRWGCWGGRQSPGRATRGPWRRSPSWCWAPQTVEVWGRCLEADRVQNALWGRGVRELVSETCRFN